MRETERGREEKREREGRMSAQKNLFAPLLPKSRAQAVTASPSCYCCCSCVVAVAEYSAGSRGAIYI